MDYTYIFIPLAVFIGFGLIRFLISRGNHETTGEFLNNRTYKVSIWFWIGILFLSIGVLAFIITLGIEGEDGWIFASVISSPVSGMIIFAVYCGLGSYIKVDGEKIIYHNGIKARYFSISGILSCNLKPYLAVEVFHAKNPKQPIVIPVCFKNIGHFVSACQKAVSTNQL